MVLKGLWSQIVVNVIDIILTWEFERRVIFVDVLILKDMKFELKRKTKQKNENHLNLLSRWGLLTLYRPELGKAYNPVIMSINANSMNDTSYNSTL